VSQVLPQTKSLGKCFSIWKIKEKLKSEIKWLTGQGSGEIQSMP
jgi:hypothetical protein